MLCCYVGLGAQWNVGTQNLTRSSLLPVSSSGPRELEPSLLPGIRTKFFCLEWEPEDVRGRGKWEVTNTWEQS